MSNVIDLPSCVLRKVLPDSHTFEITCCNFTGRTFLDCKVGNQWYMYRIPPGNYGTPFLANNASNWEASCVTDPTRYDEVEYSEDGVKLPFRVDGVWFSHSEYALEWVLKKHNLNPSTTVVIPKQ